MIIPRRYGCIFDENGEEITKVSFSKNDKTFKWNNKSYVIDARASYMPRISWIIFDDREYIYRVNDPRPIFLSKHDDKILPPSILNDILEAQHVKNVNALGKKGLEINWLYVGIAIVAFIGIYFIFLKH